MQDRRGITKMETGPHIMETLYNVRFDIVAWGRDADADEILHLKLRCPNTGTRIDLDRLLMRHDSNQYKRLRKAFDNNECIQLWLTTDFLKEKGAK